MKKILSILTGITFLIAGELEIGSTMPLMDHQLADISGKSMTLTDAKGDAGTLVIFSCNTCPWVLAWEDRYVTLAQEFIPRGIGLIAVNSNESQFESDDSMEEMIEHAQEMGYNFPYTQDPGSRLATAFGARKTPHIYLFDEKDKLVYRGAIDDNARKPRKVKHTFLADALNALLTGDKIDPVSTKALGCSIKFN